MRIDRNKFIYCNLIIFICVVVLNCNLEAATITVGSSSGSPGENNILIPISLNSAPSEDPSAFNFDLSFDTSRLLFKEVILGPKSAEAGKSLSTSRPGADIVRVIVIGFNQNIIEDGVVLNFTFDILSIAPGGKAKLNFIDPSISDPDGKLLYVTTENGEILVTESNPETSTSTSITTITTTPTTSPTTTPTTKPSTTSSVQPPLPDSTTSTSTTDISPSTTTIDTTTSIHPISSSTTTSISQLWPLLYDEMWGHKKDQNIFILRAFRDEVLINTATGKEYVSMLYENSLEISILLYQDPSLIAQTGKVVDELLSGIQSLVYNNEITLSQKTIDNFVSLLNQLEPKASPKLRMVIKRVRKDIKEETLFKCLGIKKLHNTKGGVYHDN